MHVAISNHKVTEQNPLVPIISLLNETHSGR